MSELPSTQSQGYNWIEEFHAFTSFHYLMLAICIGSFIVFCVTGRTLIKSDLKNGTNREEKFRRILAWSIILSQAFFFVRRFTPGQWDIQDSLPLHMCRWSVWIAAWAMFTLNPKMRSLLLFWGLGLSTQAFFSPMITDGLSSWGFWIYWVNHTQIVGAAIYDLAVLGYRPNKRDLYFAMLWGLMYAILVIALNWILNTNYSYLGSGGYTATSVVDQLGPYPQRLIWMILGSELIFVLIYFFSVGMLTLRTRVLNKPLPARIDAEPRNPR
ncbi:MAG: TIGR02206 family membrane protein [Phycisphaerales bacterium]|nr:TIGR02206 family membrane protein [Phycisphaerales bacterium]